MPKYKKIVVKLGRIERTEETKRLYELEGQRNAKIRECAEEWSRIFKTSPAQFWTRALPQALFDLLTSYGNETVKEVIKVYQECEKVGLL